VPTNFFGQGGGIAAADALSSLRLYFGGSASEDTTDTITYLAAAGETEFSWESGTRRHGIFTYFLLEGLQSGDHDGDGYITVSEAYAHTEARVMSEWNAGRYYSSPEYRDRSPTFRPRLGTGVVDPVLVTSPE
jgi:uncharacterized caspase-like protein